MKEHFSDSLRVERTTSALFHVTRHPLGLSRTLFDSNLLYAYAYSFRGLRNRAVA